MASDKALSMKIGTKITKRSAAKPSRTPLVTLLERLARQIRRRESSPGSKRFKMPAHCSAGYFRRQVYSHTKTLRAECMMSAVKQELTALGFAPKGTLINVDFAWLAAGIVGMLGQEGKSTTNRIRIIARDLAYADHYDVPVQFLIGFIHQEGGSKRIEQMHVARNAVARRKASARPIVKGPARAVGTTPKRASKRKAARPVKLRPRGTIKRNHPNKRAR
ncbi:hypothetical protein SPH9361_04274 [Sphingobium sp. CECT 9361]|nr:hypothetical protein SPH9361_04274 [Sphingobium sp. CECT 9361]